MEHAAIVQDEKVASFKDERRLGGQYRIRFTKILQRNLGRRIPLHAWRYAPAMNSRDPTAPIVNKARLVYNVVFSSAAHTSINSKWHRLLKA